MILLSDVTRKPSRQTRDDFRDLLLPDKKDEEDSFAAHSEKTSFHLRVAEIVRQNSSWAELVVMTLPLPKKSGSAAAPPPPELYMAWLDFITR